MRSLRLATEPGCARRPLTSTPTPNQVRIRPGSVAERKLRLGDEILALDETELVTLTLTPTLILTLTPTLTLTLTPTLTLTLALTLT